MELIILAHPSSKGFARTLAEEYAASAVKEDKDVELIDLYRSSPAEEFLSFESPTEIPEKDGLKVIQKRVTEAGRLIFFFPVWWYDSPAIMKNFFDRVFTDGFAFDWSGKKPKPLLSGKEVIMIATAGAPTAPYNLGILPLKKIWKGRFKICGIKPKFYIFGNRKKTTSVKDKEIIDLISHLAKN
jgi:NAD(P)H dehydrogenase (quinone)